MRAHVKIQCALIADDAFWIWVDRCTVWRTALHSALDTNRIKQNGVERIVRCKPICCIFFLQCNLPNPATTGWLNSLFALPKSNRTDIKTLWLLDVLVTPANFINYHVSNSHPLSTSRHRSSFLQFHEKYTHIYENSAFGFRNGQLSHCSWCNNGRRGVDSTQTSSIFCCVVHERNIPSQQY